MEIKRNSKSFGDVSILIDDEDYLKIKDHGVSLMKVKDAIYARLSISGNKRPLLHRYIMNCTDVMQVDHINHNTLDNRKCNLRICTQKQNLANRKKSKNKSSQFKGVYYSKKLGKYVSQYRDGEKKIFNGSFDTEEEAALLYNIHASKKYGEFALLNTL